MSPERAGELVPQASEDDLMLVARLRNRDESAFRELIERYHMSLVRMARQFVASQQAAEDVAQETWLGVLRGIDQFEGRSSLKTWIFRIMMNRARTRATREGRSVPFAALAGADAGDAEPAVEAERFLEAGRFAGHWAAPPRSWETVPEERLLAQETRARIQQAIDVLPDGQRAVITLRDVEGWGSAEVCNILAISESNQRVLLHRARSRVRRELENWLDTREVTRR
jgi:RNA polymerase sigma-70 factor (ECF subfamily)